MRSKIYIVTESTYLNGCANELETENVVPYAKAYETAEKARAAVRDLFIKGAVNDEYADRPVMGKGDGEVESLDALIDAIYQEGLKGGGTAWSWEATDRAVVWRIIEQEIDIAA